MQISENYRSATAGALLIYIMIGVYYTYSYSATNWTFISNDSKFNQLMIEGGISVITMLLMAFYFYKKRWTFVLVSFLLMDSFNIFFLVTDFTEPQFLHNTPHLIFLLSNLSFLFISPLFSVSLLMAEAGKHTWLKVFSIVSLSYTAVIFISILLMFSFPIWFRLYFSSFINLFLMLHFLLPDYREKIDDEVIDQSL